MEAVVYWVQSAVILAQSDLRWQAIDFKALNRDKYEAMAIGYKGGLEIVLFDHASEFLHQMGPFFRGYVGT